MSTHKMKAEPLPKLDCNSAAWKLGHEHGLQALPSKAMPYTESQTNEVYNYKDGWVTGYCERPDEED